jgi:hypothetical protein
MQGLDDLHARSTGVHIYGITREVLPDLRTHPQPTFAAREYEQARVNMNTRT